MDGMTTVASVNTEDLFSTTMPTLTGNSCNSLAQLYNRTMKIVWRTTSEIGGSGLPFYITSTTKSCEKLKNYKKTNKQESVG